MTENRKPRVLIIALDAAELTLIERLAQQDKLPNITRLRDASGRGPDQVGGGLVRSRALAELLHRDQSDRAWHLSLPAMESARDGIVAIGA